MATEDLGPMNRRLVALDFITGCLSVNPCPEANRMLRARSTGSGALDWNTIIKIARSQFITSSLWVALKRGGLADSVPPEIREYFWKTHLLATLRNRQFKEQAVCIARALNGIGVTPAILKGGVSLFLKTYDDPGGRLMADLDLLVPPDRAEECWDVARGLGYAPLEIEFDYSDHHHLRPLRSPSGTGTVEIHRRLLASPAASALPAEFVHAHLEPLTADGVKFNVPDPTLRILHILLHSGVVDRDYLRGNLCLRGLHELALIQQLHGERIDWETIRNIMGRQGEIRILDAALHRAHRMFGSPVPRRVAPGRRPHLHHFRTRLQAAWGWLDALVETAMWFSRRDICERYRCADSFLPLTAGRIRLAGSLLWQHTLGKTQIGRRSRGNLGYL